MPSEAVQSAGLPARPRVALVTGAASGIGLAIARRLCREGLRVAMLDRDALACETAAGQLAAAGNRVSAIPCDVTDPMAIERAAKLAAEALGPASILVSNAGFSRDGPLEEMTNEDWDDIQDVHLKALFLFAKLLVPGMRRQGWGRIIAVSSISARGHAGRVNYAAAKAGMEGFVRAAAVELAPCGITANAVAPGLIETAMTAVSAARRGLTVAEHLKAAVRDIPVGRAGTPEDVAHAVAFFASEEAGFVTGQVLTVSGGVTV